VTIRYSRQARRDVRQASKWWNNNRPAATELFRQELRRAFELLLTQPRLGQPVKSARLPDVRRVHLSRIHYYLYYQARGNEILVLALWHTRRGEMPEL
jgi:plasmid stabilization system protein ParE